MAFEWTDETVLNLIKEIRERRVLWDPKDPKKKNRNAKKDAFKEVASILETISDEISLKWKNLMQSYRSYRRKVKKIRTGSAAKDVYTPSWFAYQPMDDFLNDVYTPHTVVDSMKEDGEESTFIMDEEDEWVGEEVDKTSKENSPTKNSPSGSKAYIESVASVSGIGRKKSPEKRRLKSPQKCFKSPKKIIKPKFQMQTRADEAYQYLLSRKEKSGNSIKEKDECDIFGELIAAKLKKEKSEIRDMMMQEIHKIMFEVKRHFSNALPQQSSTLRPYSSLSISSPSSESNGFGTAASSPIGDTYSGRYSSMLSPSTLVPGLTSMYPPPTHSYSDSAGSSPQGYYTGLSLSSPSPSDI